MTKGFKCRWCVEEIKMKNHIMTNTLICLLTDDLKNMVFTIFLSVRWAEIKIDIRRKMTREEKHWEVGNSNMTLSHKKDGKLWLSYLQCRDQIQMKNLLIIVFWRIDNKKIEKKKNVQKTFIVVLFDFPIFRCCILLFAYATFECHVALWASTPFRQSSCGRLCSEFSKLEERKRQQWYK